MSGQTKAVQSLATDNKYKLVSSSLLENLIKVWDMKTWTKQFLIKPIEAKDGIQTVIVVSKDGEEILSVTNTGKVNIWKIKTGVWVKTLACHQSSISVLLINKEDRLVTGSEDKRVKVWNISSGECLKTLVCDEEVTCLAESEAGRIATGLKGASIKVWDVSNEKCLNNFLVVEGGPITALVFELQGLLINGSTSKPMQAWSLEKNVCAHILDSETVDSKCLTINQLKGTVAGGFGEKTL